MNTSPTTDHIPSPFVLIDLPEAERRIDTAMREFPIRDLWKLHAAAQLAHRNALSAAALKRMKWHCQALQRDSEKESLGELEMDDIRCMRDLHFLRGGTRSALRDTMSSLFDMLLTTVLDSDENDVLLRPRLDECTGLACAYADLV